MLDQEKQKNGTIGQWTVIDKIGEGSFGCIYSVCPLGKKQLSSATVCDEDASSHQNQKQNGKKYAVKTQSLTNIKQMLSIQSQIYQTFQNTKGFPHMYQYVEEQRFTYLVMDRLEYTLDKYVGKVWAQGFLSTDAVLQIMGQILRIVQGLHQKGYVYRDLKPANFMLNHPYNEIFIIDFGLCKKYLVNNKHIPLKTDKKLIGTPIFCSLNTHLGLQQSRRDDLQAWLYTCLYFSVILPWEHIATQKQLTKQQQHEQIKKIKQETNWVQLIPKRNRQQIRSKRVPECILKIMGYVKGLQFDERPNYQYLRGIIQDQYKKIVRQPMKDFEINWETKINEENLEASPTKKLQEQISTKKVSKINFKAPIKIKQTVIEKSENIEAHSNINQKQN